MQEATGRKLGSELPGFYVYRYLLAFFKGDRAAMDREAAKAEGKPRIEAVVWNVQALELARSGRLELARKISQRAIESAQRTGELENAAIYRAGMAIWEAFVGNGTVARRIAVQAFADSQGRDARYTSALALALAGDSSRARQIADDLDKRFPEDTCVQTNYLPALRGQLALNRHAHQEAVEALRVAIPNQYGVPAIAFNQYFSALYPIYVRAMVYLDAGQGGEAAAEFQKILDHRGLSVADPTGALAHLQLGRAFVLTGDQAKAKTSYQDFLTLWKDADPDVPILKQAKAEFSKLH